MRAILDALVILNSPDKSPDPALPFVTEEDLADPGYRAELIDCARADRSLMLQISGWRETDESESSGLLIRALLSIE